MLRNLTFIVKIAFFSIRPKLVFVFLSNFWATFVNAKSNFWLFFFSNFWATFWEITGHFLENLEQLVESLAPRHTGLSICLLHKWGLGNTRTRETSENHERGMMGTSILFLPFQPRFPCSRERVPQPRSQGSLLPTLRSETRVGRREPWERGCGSPRPATSPLLWITIDRRKQRIPTPFKADRRWNLLIQCCYIKEIGTCCHKSNISIVLIDPQ